MPSCWSIRWRFSLAYGAISPCTVALCPFFGIAATRAAAPSKSGAPKYAPLDRLVGTLGHAVGTGESEPKLRAAAFLARDLDLAAVIAHDSLGDHQA